MNECQKTGTNNNAHGFRSRPPPLKEVEILRLAAAPAADSPTAAKPAKSEDNTPLFWRIFGTTLLSIASLVAITLYQQLSNGIIEVRTQLKAISEAESDLVKKEDFSTRNQSLANSIKDLQARNSAALELWKERAALLDRQIQIGEEDSKQQIKELNRELQRLRERVAVVESRQAAPPAGKAAGGKQ
jgi:hypothetical protein